MLLTFTFLPCLLSPVIACISSSLSVKVAVIYTSLSHTPVDDLSHFLSALVSFLSHCQPETHHEARGVSLVSGSWINAHLVGIAECQRSSHDVCACVCVDGRARPRIALEEAVA